MHILAASDLAIASFALALTTAIVGTGWTIYKHFADKTQSAKHEAAETANALKREQLELAVSELQKTQNDILQEMAGAISRAVDPAARHGLGAEVSLQVMRSIHERQGERLQLIVKNLGPGGAQIRELDVIPTEGPENARFLTRGREVLPGGTVELLAGEDYSIDLFVPGGAWPAEFFVAWIDGTNARRERTRTLYYPS